MKGEMVVTSIDKRRIHCQNNEWRCGLLEREHFIKLPNNDMVMELSRKREWQ